ncbi:penicillin acylase family protein [Shewanella pealeana]|uniref:Penicillin amidase n=1 Tax=Shewanella pealeana (strain ATCC 700345 / ANG-SQ1) TaxID=398579 RepID=A8H6P4_SHEPA|nr:penicillin acylase family protein [Shewanella pealeana]ABV88231.1 Penicillin amidase [Shewanella pealeana ATCC 700345]
MHKTIKIALIGTSSVAAAVAGGLYLTLSLSLPKLDTDVISENIKQPVSLARDRLGTAIIHASDRQDAAYGLGYAHGQDRFFQMDLLRRNSAGELAEIFGEKALDLDKRRRFHQLRKRAELIVTKLDATHLKVLTTYAQGVNDALAAQSLSSFEYIVTGANPKPWVPADSLLVIYSMYLDLQGNTIKRDLALTQIQDLFGEKMVDFLIQPSQYQAALDGSQLALTAMPIPPLSNNMLAQAKFQQIAEPLDIGSNNWAVTGELTANGKAMLSDDMHLSFAVPIIWYRAQLNYQKEGVEQQVTGVSLPGAPAIVVGSNGKVAWGFTNAYIDTADWIAIDEQTPIYFEHETIALPDSEVSYTIEMSPFGPVKEVGDKRYALSWVGHSDYAVDMQLIELDSIGNVEQGIEVAEKMGIPVQNMLLVDSNGSVAWKPAGAYPSRTNPSNVAMATTDFQSVNWQQDKAVLPQVINPENNRLWTGNSRVVSVEQQQLLGDGGYALGARSMQIRDRLFESDRFSVEDFYQLQLDNEARFLMDWQQLLLNQLSQQPERFAKDIEYLTSWQACACSDSVGYTLVRHFRTRVIDTTFAPIETELAKSELSLSAIKRYLEPGIWQLINAQEPSWLPQDEHSWSGYLLQIYLNVKEASLAKYSDNNDMADLAWGKVNQLKIQHPFSKQIPALSSLLDMPVVEGFGDSFMPAVQGASFGASQRFIVQPGDEVNAIMTIPGGQSGHPLSAFYRSGFDDYVTQQSTPLLPGEAIHRLEITPEVKRGYE